MLRLQVCLFTLQVFPLHENWFHFFSLVEGVTPFGPRGSGADASGVRRLGLSGPKAGVTGGVGGGGGGSGGLGGRDPHAQLSLQWYGAPTAQLCLVTLPD